MLRRKFYFILRACLVFAKGESIGIVIDKIQTILYCIDFCSRFWICVPSFSLLFVCFSSYSFLRFPRARGGTWSPQELMQLSVSGSGMSTTPASGEGNNPPTPTPFSQRSWLFCTFWLCFCFPATVLRSSQKGRGLECRRFAPLSAQVQLVFFFFAIFSPLCIWKGFN